MPRGRKPGSKKTGGRVKGTKNRSAMTVAEICAAKGYDPIKELMRVAVIAEKEYRRAEEVYNKLQAHRAVKGLAPLTNDKAPEWIKIVQASGKEIAPYMYSRLKALEISGPNGQSPFGETFCEMVAALVDKKRGDKSGTP